jgi:hypothetical protein
MKVFVRQIPNTVSRATLVRFINQGLKRPWYFPFGKRDGEIARHDVIRITNPDTGTTEFHAMIDIQPAKAAVRVIRQLNAKELEGRPVEVRKWYHRSPLRDRRRNESEIMAEKYRARRLHDRRRGTLRVEIVSTPLDRSGKEHIHVDEYVPLRTLDT